MYEIKPNEAPLHKLWGIEAELAEATHLSILRSPALAGRRTGAQGLAGTSLFPLVKANEWD